MSTSSAAASGSRAAESARKSSVLSDILNKKSSSGQSRAKEVMQQQSMHSYLENKRPPTSSKSLTTKSSSDNSSSSSSSSSSSQSSASSSSFSVRPTASTRASTPDPHKPTTSASKQPVKPPSTTNAKPEMKQQQIHTQLKRVRSRSYLDAGLKDWLDNDSPARPPLKRQASVGDRFIPDRASMDMKSSQFNLANKMDNARIGREAQVYNEHVAAAIGLSTTSRILSFQSAAPADKKANRNKQHGVMNGVPRAGLVRQRSISEMMRAEPKRQIATSPEKILDAVGMVNDYYLNVLDWSKKNMVAIALDKNVYLWNADCGEAHQLPFESENKVTSLSWSQDGAHLAVGIESGLVQIWDANAIKPVRKMAGRTCYVGSQSWNLHMLSTGAQDGTIWHHDVRISKHKTAELHGHHEKVCGLKWRDDGQMLASGGNDNTVNIWDVRSTTPRFTRRNHTGAVKALAWCPWNTHLLASGGGREDKHIHFWNTTTGGRVNSIFADAQVTSLHWSKHYKELVSTHGYPKNQIAVWTYPDLDKHADFNAHEERILHSALSPDGQIIATTSSDENLKFWRVFEHDGSRPILQSPAQHAKTANLRRTTSLR
ncbi:WD40-repeat-containing domain protein [Gongronella butleri]|nr:WD40-repeat-containing domain protein [Gongronella butleri]